jgi:hypothetical protein
MIQDIAPGPLSSSPTAFTAAGPNVYFAANDNTTGFELWAVPKTNVLSSFGDVPTDSWAWSYVEALATAGLTNGCAPGQYCPGNPVSRGEMAVFLERGLRGPALTPPAPTGTVFTDVPASYWAAGWIEQLAADGITRGCAPGRYCPGNPVSRGEMAVFLLRARHGGPGRGHPVYGRPSGLLGGGVDRAARRRGPHQRLRARQLLPGRRGVARPDGRLPDADVLPAVALRTAPPADLFHPCQDEASMTSWHHQVKHAGSPFPGPRAESRCRPG